MSQRNEVDELDDDKPANLPQRHNLDSHLTNVSNLVRSLDRSTSELPIVDEQGNSECPFAERLYRQNQEIQAKVQTEMRSLRSFLAYKEKEVKRLRWTLLRVRSDRERLATQEARQKYDEGQQAAEREYRRAVVERDAILEVLRRAESAYRAAKSRSFPGMEPSSEPSPPAAPPARDEVRPPILGPPPPPPVPSPWTSPPPASGPRRS